MFIWNWIVSGPSGTETSIYIWVWVTFLDISGSCLWQRVEHWPKRLKELWGKHQLYLVFPSFRTLEKWSSPKVCDPSLGFQQSTETGFSFSSTFCFLQLNVWKTNRQKDPLKSTLMPGNEVGKLWWECDENARRTHLWGGGQRQKEWWERNRIFQRNIGFTIGQATGMQ